MTDDSLQFSLFEMSGVSHFVYIPEILYLYSMDYGGNVYATQGRIRERKSIRLQVSKFPKL